MAVTIVPSPPRGEMPMPVRRTFHLREEAGAGVVVAVQQQGIDLVMIEDLLPVADTARNVGVLVPDVVGKDLDPTIHEHRELRAE